MRLQNCRDRGFSILCLRPYGDQPMHAKSGQQYEQEQRPQPELMPAASWLLRLGGVRVVIHGGILAAGSFRMVMHLMRFLANYFATTVNNRRIAGPPIDHDRLLQRGR
jgi:hypothetical protein